MKNLAIHPQLRNIPKEQTLCITGHRPEKLPEEKLDLLKQAIYSRIDYKIAQGYQYFLDGLADGVDYIIAEYLFHLREKNSKIQVIGIQPCDNYERFFQSRGYDLAHLKFMKQSVDILIKLSGSYNDINVFATRNKFMVDHASAVLAVCSRKRSGAMQTLHYAQKQGLSWCRLEPDPNLLYTPAPELWPAEQVDF